MGGSGVDRFGMPVPAGGVATLPPPPLTDTPAGGSVDHGGRMLSSKAIGLTLFAIGIGAVGMGFSWWLSRRQGIEVEAYLRYSIVITLAVYAVVGALIVTRLAPGLRLRWREGNPARAILTGAFVGGGLSALLLWAVSAAAGHLSPDPRFVATMSEGDLAHIVVSFGIACVCAPLVEEVLFRGILLESLQARHGVGSTRGALVLSGIAFSAWHLNPAALRYYVVMGMLLGGLYLKRGLICSMAAHVAFNGVLTVGALAVVLAPAHTVSFGSYGHFTMTQPGGWRVVDDPGSALALEGPSEAAFLVYETPGTAMHTPAEIAQRLRTDGFPVAVPGLDFDTSSVRQVEEPIGPAVELDMNYHGRGTVVMVPRDDELLVFIFASGGSPKAQEDFPRMLDSVRVA